jgi:outer membrane protein TolC
MESLKMLINGKLSRIICMSLVIVWCHQVYAPASPKKTQITLEDTIRAVLSTNPEILIKKAELRAAEQRILQVEGFEAANRLVKARTEAYQCAASVREVMLLLSFQAAEQYIAVRRFERLLKVSKENVSRHKELLVKIKQQVDAGKTTISDVTLLEERLNDALAALEDITGDLHSAIGNYIEIVGFEPISTVHVDFDKAKLPPSLEEAIKYAISNNRTVKVAQAAVEVAKADLEVTTAPLSPASDLQMAAKRREFIERVNVAKHKIEQEKRRAEKEVRVSYAQWISASTQAAALQKASDAKAKVLNTHLSQFNAGQRSFIDILDANHEHFLTKGSLITAQAAMDHAALRLMASINQFFELFGIAERGY